MTIKTGCRELRGSAGLIIRAFKMRKVAKERREYDE